MIFVCTVLPVWLAIAFNLYCIISYGSNTINV